MSENKKDTDERKREEIKELLNDIFMNLEDADGIVMHDTGLSYSPIKTGRAIQKLRMNFMTLLELLGFKVEEFRIREA